jgi:hypothetical protein
VSSGQLGALGELRTELPQPGRSAVGNVSADEDGLRAQAVPVVVIGSDARDCVKRCRSVKQADDTHETILVNA